MSIKISALPNIVAANIQEADVLPLVSGGITSHSPISELRIKLGFPLFTSGSRTVTDLRVYLANNAVYNVKDFGAVGDGVTDDTLAFNRARQAQIDNQGGAIYVPTSFNAHSYAVTTLDERGTAGIATSQPYVLIGDDINRTQLQQIAGTTSPIIELGKYASLTGCVIWNIWLTGQISSVGGLRLGGETFSVILGQFNLRVNSFHKTPGANDYGAFGISLEGVQQCDFNNTRVDACYNNYFRPNWGFISATTIHGGATDISHADNRGIQLAGEVSDLDIHNATIENNTKEGISDISNPGTGTVTVANSAGFPATFSVAQTGFIGEKGYFVSGGHMYLATGFNAGKTTCTNTTCLTGGPNFFAAAAFRYEFRSNIRISGGTYDEANCIGGGNGDIAFQGSSAPNSYAQPHIDGVNFHSGGPKLYLDHVGKSTVQHCTGLSFVGAIVTTANARVHFAFNSDTSATDMTGIYAALPGNITWEELDRTTGFGASFAYQVGGERYYSAAQRHRGLNTSDKFAVDTGYENAGVGLNLADAAVGVIASVGPMGFLEIADTVTTGVAFILLGGNVNGPVIIAQTGANHYSTVKDTAGKINVYIETGAIKVQNKAAAGAGVAISLYGHIRKAV